MINLTPPFPIRVHFLTWILIAGAVVTGQFLQLITLFIIVFIHEMGHVLMAHRYNWNITELTILPFGGVVNMNPPSRENGWEEIWIALAGPLCNGGLILLSFLLYRIGLSSWDFMNFFVIGNASIALFNLLPIYPLDGGRILQAILSFYFPFKKAVLRSLYLGATFILLILLLSFWKFTIGIELWFILPYLLIMIYLELKRLPYRFLSFLFYRHISKRKALSRTAYLPVMRTSSMKHATEGMYRHRYHLFMLHGVTKGMDSIYYPEQRILDEIFEKKRPFATFAEIEKD